ncbi:MAG: peptidylprolyl isomerase [Planctomycetota bacterium]
MKNDSAKLNFFPSLLSARIAGAVGLLVAGLLMANPALAQPVDDSPAADVVQLSYKELSRTIRENEAEINRLYTTMPIGNPERQKSYLSKIDKLTKTNNQLRTKLDDAAIASFRANPTENPVAARIVYKSVMSKLDPIDINSHFDPRSAQQMGLMMLQSIEDPELWPETIDYPNLVYQVFRASFAIEDFQTADGMLQKLEAINDSVKKTSIREQLDSAKERWNRELLIRRFETNTNDLPRVKFETSDGDFVVELYENHAPQTVANFVSLVEKNFYNDLEFFAVRPGEAVQTGCHKNNGTTDPGYRIKNELDREQLREHFAGTLSMVTEKDGTAGSQFLITHQPNPKIDGVNTVFGRVIEGMDVVLQLKTVDRTKSANGEASKIIKASVVRKREREYKPTIASNDGQR